MGFRGESPRQVNISTLMLHARILRPFFGRPIYPNPRTSCYYSRRIKTNRKAMAIKAALLTLALGAATAQDNTERYTVVTGSGTCVGNGGSSDTINSMFRTGLSQTQCETECSNLGGTACVGYAYETGNNDAATATCFVYGPALAGSCSNPFQDTKEKCQALGQCSETSVGPCGITEGSNCLGLELACTNAGGTWTSAAGVWTEPVSPWTGDSYATTHIAAANGDAAYTCYDADLEDHEATCHNSDQHNGYTVHQVGIVQECAPLWTDVTVSGCENIEGCPATPCGSDDDNVWCCNDVACDNWHYCACERDFEAGGKVESACDVAAGCVYTAKPVMEPTTHKDPKTDGATGHTLGFGALLSVAMFA